MKLCIGTCLCACYVALAGHSVQAMNLLANPNFDSDLSGWTAAYGEPTVGVAQTVISYSNTEGNGPGSASLDRVSSAEFDNKDVLYQIVDIDPNGVYALDAEWKGDLLNGNTGRNWAEVIVKFEPALPTIADGSYFDDASIVYKKATDGGPNEPAGPFDWESILASPAGGSADGVFTAGATDEFMVIGFNLGGRDLGRNAAPGYYFVDNATLTAVPEPASVMLLLLCGLTSFRRRR